MLESHNIVEYYQRLLLCLAGATLNSYKSLKENTTSPARGGKLIGLKPYKENIVLILRGPRIGC